MRFFSEIKDILIPYLRFIPFLIISLITFAFIYSFFFPYSFNNIDELRFGDALYFSVVTLTTLGFGDITPSFDAPILKAIIGINSLFGIIFLGILINSFVKNRENIENNIKIKQVYSYIEISSIHLKLVFRLIFGSNIENKANDLITAGNTKDLALKKLVEESDMQTINKILDIPNDERFMNFETNLEAYFSAIKQYSNDLMFLFSNVSFIKLPDVEKAILNFLKIKNIYFKDDNLNSILKQINKNDTNLKNELLRSIFKEMILISMAHFVVDHKFKSLK